MFSQAKHRVVLIEILKDLYEDPQVQTILGFKGGTAAMLFYDLPRLSVDLDFDLLDEDKKALVLGKVKAILDRHGILREAIEKKYTLLFIISYEKGQRTIKLDISKRKGSGSFEMKSYLGIPMLIMNQGDMVAGKLSALLTRKKFAMRDAFDLCFFLQNNWQINEKVVTVTTGLSLKKALRQAIKKVSVIDKTQLLAGLGELLDTKQKAWVKDKLKDELLFRLRLYQKIHADT